MSAGYQEAGLVVAAGGGSRRFGATNKLLEPLGDMPVFVHCLRRLGTIIPPERTVLVVPAGEQDAFAAALSVAGLDITLVPGGESRPESVLAGLRALAPSVDLVAVQDAARPFTSADLLQRCLESARRHGSGVAAHAVTDTIKTVDEQDFVLTTPDRSQLRATETPQVFLRAQLAEAYSSCLADGLYPSDEAQAIEALNHPVHLVVHREANPKLTYATDLPLFSYLLNAESRA
jgi:2-C-methyl-D-erythritol 4-phosphate cytidylyltransferase